MKKSTKKKWLILVLSIALVVANVVVFSMARQSDNSQKTSANNTTNTQTESQTTSDNDAERASIEAVLGTKKNLKQVNKKLKVVDSDGKELKLSDIKTDEYDGFIYKLSDPTEIQLAVMTEASDKLTGGAQIDTVVEGESFTADSLETISKVAAAETLEYVEPNYIAKLCAQENDAVDGGDAKLTSALVPNDTYYNSTFKWVQDIVNAPEVWGMGEMGSSDVTVAVIDSGIDHDHEDLNTNNILQGKYFIKSRISAPTGTDTEGEQYHGTFCAGMIAAQVNNKKGIPGEMPNVKILPVKVFGKNSEGGYYSDIAKAVDYAREQGADVISMSLGGTGTDSTLNTAIQNAVKAGIIVVAAAGNEGDDDNPIEYPASYDNVISVGSVDSDLERSYFSNYNSKVDVVAGGSSVKGLYLNSGYYTASGTSFSTPQVAALAAMVKSMDETTTPEMFETIIQQTSKDLGTSGRDDEYGWGLADFEAVYKYIKGNKNIRNCSVEMSPNSFVYDGTEKKPAITVKDGETTLKNGTDYEIVSWSNNKNAGTASCTIKGKKDYYNIRTDNFAITPKDINAYSSQVKISNCTYTGSAQTPGVTITGLTSGTDYTVSYSNNTNAGTATATITGKGNYGGSFDKQFTIAQKDISGSSSQATVASCTYTGSPLTPSVTISGLKSGTDYTLTYSNNINASSNAKVMVTGTGNCTGSFEKTFKISQKSISGYSSSAVVADCKYNGSAQTPAVTIAGLSEGTDFNVAYSNNTNVASSSAWRNKPTAKVTGQGNYTGSFKKYFTISKGDISDYIDKTTVGDCTYNGSAQKPGVTIDGLVSGTDYTVTYSNNTNASSNAKITVTGKGNYEKSFEKTFTISPKSIGLCVVNVSPNSYSFDGKEHTPAVTLKDGTNTLVAGSDYTVGEWSDNVNIGTAECTITGKNNYSGTVAASFEIVDTPKKTFTVSVPYSSLTYTGAAQEQAITVKDGNKVLSKGSDYTVGAWSNNTSVGTAKCEVTGIGEYAGTVEASFAITAKPISQCSANVQKASVTYDGTPKVQTITVKDGSKTLVENLDYTLGGWNNNTKAGTASCEVRGMGNYKGSISASFKILPVSLYDASVSVSDMEYTGKTITPKVSVIYAGTSLVNTVDYTIKCSSKNVGKATVTIVGKGCYSGSVSRSFKINPKGTTIKTPKSYKKAFTAKWSKQSAKMSKYRVTGYQVQYSTSSKFSSKKTVTVKGYSKTSKKISNLKSKKKYYVRVRTYLTVSDKKYYSKWSSVNTVKTK